MIPSENEWLMVTDADIVQEEASSPDILYWWKFFRMFPFGKWFFSLCLGFLVPYSGSLGFKVVDLRPGYARVELKDRWFLRNHLGSLHAAALTNLLELTSGLSMSTTLPNEWRAIVTNLSIHFTKKARKLLIAECLAPPAELGQYSNRISIIDEDGNLVSYGKGYWLIGEKLLRK